MRLRVPTYVAVAALELVTDVTLAIVFLTPATDDEVVSVIVIGIELVVATTTVQLVGIAIEFTGVDVVLTPRCG